MFNCILDGFPEDYMGYPIRSDFRIGIKLTLLTEDDTIDDFIKQKFALTLLYKEPNKIEDIGVALDGLVWFLTCGNSEIYYDDDYKDTKPTEQCINFNQDSMDIWGAFWAKGIDLTTCSMHWFKFMSALGNLGDCPLTQKMTYRATDLSKMRGETKNYYKELKDKYKIRKLLSKEEYLEKKANQRETFGDYFMWLKSNS